MASTKKLTNKLEVEISKKQEHIDDYLATQIYLVNGILQDFLDEEKETKEKIAELRRRQEELKNHKPGQLANVSIYEFINDWLRPELAWHIFGYLADDPHKEGVKKAQTHRGVFRKAYRRRMWNGKMCKMGNWRHLEYRPESQWLSNPEPYCQLWLYKTMTKPFYRQEARFRDDPRRTHYPSMKQWQKNYWFRYNEELTEAKLINTNPILYELWSYYETKNVGKDGNQKFVIPKKDIVNLLKVNKVPGRTDLTYGVKCSEMRGTNYIYDEQHRLWRPPFTRRELVGALMKLE